MKKKVCGIYAITNQVNGKVYVGKSISVYRRWNEHTYDLNKNKHGNEYLQNAWNKYGMENFLFEVIEECEETLLHTRELYWISQFNCLDRELGYNLREEDENRKMSPESKQRLREKTLEHYNRLVEEGYYITILYNLNTGEQKEYTTIEEAKNNSSVKSSKNTNFLKGEVLVYKRDFTENIINKLKEKYQRYLLSQQSISTKSGAIYAVNAYNFSDIKTFPSKTNACASLFNSPNETNRVSKVIDTNERFRYYYFFSSEQSMSNILSTCHTVRKRDQRVEKKYRYILNHPDGKVTYLYQAKDAINYIPNSTANGIKKLITKEKLRYYDFTMEKIDGGVEELYV